MSTPIGNCHDVYFKRVLGEPALAGTFLREHLPAAVAELLGPERPEPVAGSFVDEELREHHSDLLFRVRLKAGGDALAYVLMEHKSTPDRGARLQLLRYVVRVLTDWYERNGKRLPLPPVLPLLANQGPEGWRFSTEFVDLFGEVPQALRPYLPSFRHALVDLAQVDDEELSSDPRLRAFMKALKYCRWPDLNEHLTVVLAEEYALQDTDLFVVLAYLSNHPVGIDYNRMRKVLSRRVPERTENMVRWVNVPFFDEIRAEGKAEASTGILIRQLQKRFGGLPDAVRERIVASTTAEVDCWLDRVCDAPSLWAVFDTN